jgi:hypothetical protein
MADLSGQMKKLHASQPSPACQFFGVIKAMRYYFSYRSYERDDEPEIEDVDDNRYGV